MTSLRSASVMIAAALSVFVLSVRAQEPFEFQQRLSSGGVNDDYANIGVAISGDTAVVTSQNGIYVYLRSGLTWSQQTILVPSDGLSGCGFPFPIDLEGSTVIVGCPNKTINGNANHGAAYVFVRNNGTWSEQRLLSSQASANDRFGSSVAINGESIVVGSLSDTVGTNANQGSAYIFTRTGSSWSEQARLTADDGGSGHGFGRKVGLDGDTAVISRGYNAASSPANPSVYIFVRTGSTWQQQQRLSVCEPSAIGNCRFGYSIAVFGDRLVVGNEWLNVDNKEAQGGVYVFTRSGAVWAQKQKLTAGDGSNNDYFGVAIGLSNRTLVIGAVADIGMPGKAYVFEDSEGKWNFRQKLQPGANRNAFGQNLSLDNNSLIVAAAIDTGTPGAFGGAAYIYARPAPSLKVPFDYDGDGKSDYSVWRPSDGTWYLALSDSGSMYVQPWGRATDRITPADYDGDGVTDMAVYRPSEGKWYVIYSQSATINAISFGLDGDVPLPQDFDGDGKADFGIWRPSDGTWYLGMSQSGSMYVLPFSRPGTTTTTARTMPVGSIR